MTAGTAWLLLSAAIGYMAVGDPFGWQQPAPPASSREEADTEVNGPTWIASLDQFEDSDALGSVAADSDAVAPDPLPAPTPLVPNWQQATHLVGQPATLRGEVKWCDFGNKQETSYSFDDAGHVTFMVSAAEVSHFSASQLHSYCSAVEVTGMVTKRGTDVVVPVTSPAQVTVLGAAQLASST